MRVVISEDNMKLDEVVVVGIWRPEESKSDSAVASVKSDENPESPNGQIPPNALIGQIPD